MKPQDPRAEAIMRDVPQEDMEAVGALLNTARKAITAAIEEKQLALENVAAQGQDVKALGTIFLIVLTVLVSLVIWVWFGLDAAHDNTIGPLVGGAALLVPVVLIVVIIKRIARG